MLDVQLEFLTTLILPELKDSDVIYSTEGHVTLQPDLQVNLEQLNARPDNVFYKTRFTSQKVAASILYAAVTGLSLGHSSFL